MTELERQLMTALRKLSPQYERERTQHAAQIATLRQQVERFAGQVTRLTVDYRALAATLRGRWNWCASPADSADWRGDRSPNR